MTCTSSFWIGAAVRARAHGYTMSLSDRRNRKFRDPGLGAQAATPGRRNAEDRYGTMRLHGRQAAVPQSFRRHRRLYRRPGRLVDGRRAHAHLSIHPAPSRIGLLPSPAWLAVWLRVRVPASRSVLDGRAGSRCSCLPVVLLAPWLPGAVPAALYIWTGPLRVWLWVVVRRGPARAGGRSAGLQSWLARDRARPAPRAVAGRGHRGRRVPGRRLADLSAPPDRRRAALPRHRAEPPQGSRPANRKQPPPRRLSRVLRGRPAGPTTCGAAATARSTPCTRRAFPSSSRPVLALFGYPGVLVFLALRQRVGDGAGVDGHVARDVGRGGQLVRLGDGRADARRSSSSRSSCTRTRPARRSSWSACWRSSTDRLLSTRRIVATGAALAMLPWLHTRYVAAAVMLGSDARARGRRRPLGRDRRPRAAVDSARQRGRAGSRSSTRSTDRPTRAGRTAAARRATSPTSAAGSSACSSISSSACCPPRRCSCARWPGLVVLMRRSAAAGGGASATRRALRSRRGRVPDVVGRQQLARAASSSRSCCRWRFRPASGSRRAADHTGKLLGLGALTVSLLTTITLAGVDRGILLYNFRDGSSRLLTWLSPLVNITSGLPERLPDDAVGGVAARAGVDRGDRADRGRGDACRTPRRRADVRSPLALGFSADRVRRPSRSRSCGAITMRRPRDDAGDRPPLAFLRQYDPDSAAVRDPRTARSAACARATC